MNPPDSPRKRVWPAAVLLAAWILAWAGPQPPVADTGRQSLNPDAPAGTEILGQLKGRWAVRMDLRDAQGNWHPQEQYREWRWYYILDGQAIQDDFITESRNDKGEVVSRSVGTNIRIYNADENLWYMAWIHSNRRRLATFTAVNQKDTVIMRGKNDQGRDVRNTFHDIRHDSFEWTQEWTFDEGESWVPVVRIHATRIE